MKLVVFMNCAPRGSLKWKATVGEWAAFGSTKRRAQDALKKMVPVGQYHNIKWVDKNSPFFRK